MPGRISFPASKMTCARPMRSFIAFSPKRIGPTATRICSCSGARFAGRLAASISTGRSNPRRLTLAQLKAQRDAAMRGNSPRGRRDDIVAELARNHCGEQYVHEQETQRSHSSSIFSFFSNEEQNSPDEPPSSHFAPSPPPGYGGGSSSFRTWCVRECDGFYFPISNYASESHFHEDEAKCHSLCASPAELFYHRSDQDVDQMVSLNGRPYASMPYAFKNRKVYIRGCSCNAREYSPEQIAKSVEALKMSKRADASAGKSDAAFARRISEAVQNAPGGHPAAATPAPSDDGHAPLSRPPSLTRSVGLAALPRNPVART